MIPVGEPDPLSRKAITAIATTHIINKFFLPSDVLAIAGATSKRSTTEKVNTLNKKGILKNKKC